MHYPFHTRGSQRTTEWKNRSETGNDTAFMKNEKAEKTLTGTEMIRIDCRYQLGRLRLPVAQ